jgi:hypothetical protein
MTTAQGPAMPNLHRFVIASLFSSAALVPAVASADVHEGASVRSGATFGASIGAGAMSCQTEDGDDCDSEEAGALTLHAGALVTPQLAVVGQLWGMAHTSDNITVSQGIAAAALRAWPAPRLWLEGGLGVARAKVEYDGDLVDVMEQSDLAPAAVAGIGFEVLSSDSFALDLHLRGGSGLYEDEVLVYGVNLGVGASFY